MAQDKHTERLVTVVIPCWNRRAYIGQALNSVLEQTQKDVEIIVVDDGSTDDSAHVVSTEFPMVKLLRQPNRGVSAARNTGLRHCTTPYVIFLDSDDWFSPDVVETHLRAAARWPEADVFAVDCASIDGSGNLSIQSSGWPEHPDVPLELLLLRPPPFIGSQMYRTDALRRIGGYDEAMRSHEDSDCLIRVVLSGAKVMRSGAAYCVYRRTENSLTRRALWAHKYAIHFVAKLRSQTSAKDTRIQDLLTRRLHGVRLRYWYSFFAFHWSWRANHVSKFLYHLARVLIVDRGYLRFVLQERPWRSQPDQAF